MKSKTFLSAVLGVVAAGAMALQVQATPIYVGDGDLQNSGPSASTSLAETLIGSYNESYDPNLPALPPGGGDETIISGPITFTLDSGCDYGYVLFKFGQGAADYEAELWYLLSGESVEPTFNDDRLSHYRVWCHQGNNVPDAGTTLAMLGLATLGLGGLRRRFGTK